MRDACRRHLEDLANGPGRGLSWDLKAARRAIGFFADILRLNGGAFEGAPYRLLGWQVFIVASLFGWKGQDGYRRFRTAYIETGKGSGKSPLAAGIGLYGLVADGEARAEVYSAATKKDQAQILFRDAVAMVDQSPELGEVLAKSGVGENVWNLAHRDSGSWFRPISADDGQSGPRPHFTLVDELHEHRGPYVIEMLKAGQKTRRQPLLFAITNSGTDRHSVCAQYHDYAAKVAAGALVDDSFFSFVCALDEGDDPMKDEACWPKANPSLVDGLPGIRYLREQVAQARGMAGKESIVRRLNFCEWVEAESPWISRDIWFAAADPEFDVERLLGRRCWGGLDLSSTQDLTALALLFEPVKDDPFWRLTVNFWLPGDGLAEKAERDRVPYPEWRTAGFLEALPGRAINNMAVARRAAEISAMYSLQELAFDRYRIEPFKHVLDQEGIALPLVPFGQGYKDMAPAVDEFERLLISGEMRHSGNECLTWNAASAVVISDPAGNRKVAKDRATGRVDGIVAAVMAAGRKGSTATPEPEYQMLIFR